MADTFNSFYGGRKGASFIISKTFPSVEAMVKEFKNVNKTDVGFGEYVLIRPESAEDVDNGKVYLRGYNYTNDFGGAEYIGQFVGPTGACPDILVFPYGSLPLKPESDSDWKKVRNQEYEVETHPGVTPEGNPDSKVKVATGIFRNQDNTRTEAHIGFSFPHPVITTNNAILVSPYEKDSKGNLINQSTITQSDENPFEYKVNLKIPKGIKGDSLKSIVLNTDNAYFSYETNNFDEQETKTTKTIVPTTLLNRVYLNNNTHTLYADYITGRVDDKTHPIKTTKELGCVLNRETGLVYGNLSLQELYENESVPSNPNIADIITQLGIKYPNGNFKEGQADPLKGMSLEGRIITIDENTEGTRGFYAFNYAGNTDLDRKWYRIGSLGESGAKEIVVGGSLTNAYNALAIGGIWIQDDSSEEEQGVNL